MIRFSVIIPTFNRKDCLLECLASVFAQTHPAHEIIVVDDGSTDGTIEALSCFGDRVIVLEQENAGPGAARNRGAKVASGEYLAFLDSDDIWFPWTLEAFATLTQRHGKPTLLSGLLRDFAATDELRGIVDEAARGEAFEDFLESHSKGYFCGGGMIVILRPEFEHVGGFEEDRLNAEDHDLVLKLGTASGFVKVLSPVTLARRIHDSNETSDMRKTILGIQRIVSKEKEGRYPGGSERAADRRNVITKHVRPAVLGGLRVGSVAEAWRLYRETFGWNLRLGRGSYLLAVPLIAATNVVRSAVSS